jgi:uncharacterized membrane protein
MSQSHIQDHVELIARHEQEFLAQRTPAEKLSDAVAGFIGSLRFVGLHIVLMGTWIVCNSIPAIHHWDPRPYALLQTCAALESIFIASFILMRQARLGRRQDERDHLMLQVLLLTEKEITAMLGMNRQIATEVGLDKVANEKEVRELSKDVSIEDMAQTIKEILPNE